METGNLVIAKDTEQLMTVMRLVGDGGNDALEMMDNQLRANGYEDGAAICQWFVVSELNTATFNPRELELAPEKVSTEEEPPKEDADEELLSDDDFDF